MTTPDSGRPPQRARAYIRHPSDMPIELVTDRAAAGQRREHLANISFGGLCCESDKDLARGSLVKVRIPLVRPPFEATGKVIWCAPANGRFKVGVQFLEEDAFRARMVEQVCYIEKYRAAVQESEGRRLSSEEAAVEWIGKYAAEFPNPDLG
ncbi:MAG: PilZ domain-containing protein [Pseudomonadota bacterium]|nr:PilZ domain-containing protein [Pseudomonadota bacterium]